MKFRARRAQKRKSPKHAQDTTTLTSYGAERFRTSYYKDQYVGDRGKPQEAVILDIDGTLQDWGEVVAKKVSAFCKKHFEEGRVLLVFTARVHEHEFQRSFDWLISHLPYPFIGPFCRSRTDRRYASEFKRELAQMFEDAGVYKIVGAADDNNIVNDMWKQWAIDHFEDPADFDLLECNYTTYSQWRKDLPTTDRKPYTSPIYSSYASPGSPYQGGYPVTAWGVDPVDKRYKSKNDFITQPQPGDPISVDPMWKSYFATRELTGAYMGVDRHVDLGELLDDHRYGLDRGDLEMLASAKKPELTAEDLEGMGDTELRTAAGVSSDEYLDVLYADVEHRFGGRYEQWELDYLTEDQLEHLLTLDQDVADEYVLHIVNSDEGDGEITSDTKWSDNPEQNARIQERMDLEDLLLKIKPSADVKNMDIKDIEIEIGKTLGEVTDPPVQSMLVSEIVERHLPPLGVPTEEVA